MAQQTITGGDGTTGQTGEEVKDIINENFTELYERWRGNWVWADNSNNIPSWAAGSLGISVGDRGSVGDAGFIPDGALLIKTAAGTTISDIKFI